MRSVSYIKVDKIKGILQNFVVVTSKAYFTYVVARVLLWDAAFYKAKLALKATAKKTKDDTDEPEQEEGDGTDNNTAFFIISTLRLILESNAYEYDIASLDFSLSLSLSPLVRVLTMLGNLVLYVCSPNVSIASNEQLLDFLFEKLRLSALSGRMYPMCANKHIDAVS
jgi:hypothetical protein